MGDNTFKSNNFYMSDGDILSILSKDEAGTFPDIFLNGSTGVVEDGVIRDVDGNSYNVITIGNQQWLSSNLKTTKYRDGSSIPNLTVAANWAADTTGAYCWYDNDTANKPLYGALYNWHAVNNVKKLAPLGWRVASVPDYIALFAAIGGTSIAGGNLKSTLTGTYWDSPNTGATDLYGFNLRGGGVRSVDGVTAPFNGIKQAAYLWTSTESAPYGRIEYVLYDSAAVDGGGIDKAIGCSVRCIRDI